MIIYILVGLVFSALFVFCLKRSNKQVQGTDGINIQALCESPNCVRCNNNENVVRSAGKIFANEFQNEVQLKRIHDTFQESQIVSKQTLEKQSQPRQHLFHCHWLSSKPVWKHTDLPESYQNDVTLLQENIDLFTKDYEHLSYGHRNQKFENWEKYYLVNQGSVIVDHLQTNQVLKSCKNLLTRCLFGYQFFSVLSPGVSISEHVGASNVRLRCHVSLKVPQDTTMCSMKVSSETIFWVNRGVLVFDDSLPHSVTYEDGNEKRVVLLVDFWHPDLTSEERNCIQKCFPATC